MQFEKYLVWLLLGILGWIAPPAIAQLEPDLSLPPGDRPQIILDTATQKRIQGGIKSNQNLLHQFREFNISKNEKVYFDYADQGINIQNIFTRIVGDNASVISGKLGVLGDANLVLINPNGITFNKKAELDISGSFYATTARDLLLLNNDLLNLIDSEPEALLSINPNSSFSQALRNYQGDILTTTKLKGNSDSVFSLSAQNLDLDDINTKTGDLQLSAMGRLTINGSEITTALKKNNMGQSGDIFIDAGTLEILNGGKLIANTAGHGDGGFIEINVGDRLLIDGVGKESGIFNRVEAEAIGHSGGIEINAGRLDIMNLGRIDAGSGGVGDSGAISINVDGDINLDGMGLEPEFPNLNVTGLLNDMEFPSLSLDNIFKLYNLLQAGQSLEDLFSQGNAKKIDIKAANLFVKDGAVITNSILANRDPELGKSEGIEISLLGNLEIQGNDQITGIFSTVGVADDLLQILEIPHLSAPLPKPSVIRELLIDAANQIIGSAGNITVNAENLMISDQGAISTGTYAKGDAGNIKLEINNQLNIRGSKTQALEFTGILSNTDSSSNGNAGSIQIATADLLLQPGGFILTSAEGRGLPGNIQIEASEDIVVDGEGQLTGIFSEAISPLKNIAKQEISSRIELTGKNLSLFEGGLISTNSRGDSDAGTVIINLSEDLLLDGRGLPLSNVFTNITTGITSSADFPRLSNELAVQIYQDFLAGKDLDYVLQKGDAGDIEIDANNINIFQSSAIGTTTFGFGNAGSIRVKADNNIVVDGQGEITGFTSISSFPDEDIFKGVVDLSALPDEIPDEAAIAILLKLANQVEGGVGNPEIPEAKAIEITANNLTLMNRGLVSAGAYALGDAGDIKINVSDTLLIEGSGEGITGIVSDTDATSTANAGSIVVDPNLIWLKNGGRIGVNAQGQGEGGDILLIGDRLILENQSSITAATASNIGGNIELQIGEYLLLKDRSEITATAGTEKGFGGGGNITIDAPLIIAMPEALNQITANAFAGKGGNININTESILGSQYLNISASSELNTDGTVAINTPDVDPTSGLVKLSDGLVEDADQISQECETNKDNSFAITGWGGLPDTPYTYQNDDPIWTDFRQEERLKESSETPPQEPEELAQASSWQYNEEGKVVLLSQQQVMAKTMALSCPH